MLLRHRLQPIGYTKAKRSPEITDETAIERYLLLVSALIQAANSISTNYLGIDLYLRPIVNSACKR
ncbi:hypothetical protein [Pantanalinema sp. GBBB05]|uniref:hypothetical protein n=1 Tax=Pantanalinema sp. GBBB05 TaxID=2604139 RepID=UPI001DAAA7F4|nr:hypothetical protein [Pantanalinema sp. GBBB05]